MSVYDCSCSTCFLIKGDFEPSEIIERLNGSVSVFDRRKKGESDGNVIYPDSRLALNACRKFSPYSSEQMEKTIKSLYERENILNELREMYDLEYYLFVKPVFSGDVLPDISPSDEVIGFCSRTKTELVYSIDLCSDVEYEPQFDGNGCKTYFLVDGDFDVDEVITRVKLRVEKFRNRGESNRSGKAYERTSISAETVTKYSPFVCSQAYETIKPLIPQIDKLDKLKRMLNCDYSLMIVPYLYGKSPIDLSLKQPILDFCYRTGTHICYDIYRMND